MERRKSFVKVAKKLFCKDSSKKEKNIFPAFALSSPWSIPGPPISTDDEPTGPWNWKLWKYDSNSTQLSHHQKFEDLGEVYTISTLQEKLQQHRIDDEINFPNGSSYCFFKSSIKPTWENTTNHPGGRLIMYLFFGMSRAEVEVYWQRLLTGLVEWDFDGMKDYICGVKVRWKDDSSPRITLYTTKDINGVKHLDIIKQKVRELFASAENPPRYSYRGYQVYRERVGWEPIQFQ